MCVCVCVCVYAHTQHIFLQTLSCLCRPRRSLRRTFFHIFQAIRTQARPGRGAHLPRSHVSAALSRTLVSLFRVESLHLELQTCGYRCQPRLAPASLVLPPPASPYPRPPSQIYRTTFGETPYVTPIAMTLHPHRIGPGLWARPPASAQLRGQCA